MKKSQNKKNDDLEEVEVVDDSIIEMAPLTSAVPAQFPATSATDLLHFDTK
jgi:hypothetical protein